MINIYDTRKNDNEWIIDGENGFCNYPATMTLEHVKTLYHNGIFTAKQVTLHNTDISRNDKMQFVNNSTGELFDFASLHDKTNRTYDGLTYHDYILYSICRHTDGDKMENILSISGSPFNTYCDKKAQNKQFVCCECYSRKQLKRYIDLHFKCEKNEYFYSNIELLPSDIPFIPGIECRYESFGELTTELKVKNYCLICEQNKHCFFCFFTKLPFVIDNAFSKYGITKPDNCKMLQSSPCLNVVLPVAKKYWFIDCTFTVHTKQDIEQNAVNINCLKKCRLCRKCYEHNNITEIHEQLK